MIKKYELVDESGRKRLRALRNFSVQGRDVNVHDLGGYVYDENTLSQEGNCWIFSGSLEYPGVRVMDEAIVDMGNNLPKTNARPKATIISGNSRIMGAISFETQSFNVAQTPAMFEQGSYNVASGNVPVKMNASNRVRIPVPVFAGTVGKVTITSTAYEAMLVSLNEAGIVVFAGAWTVGGPAVTLTSTAPYILVLVRKVGETAISPADVTAAGVTITRAKEVTVRVSNSSIVPVYNGAAALATSILRYEVTDPSGEPFQVNIQNSYLRIECSFNTTNVVRANADFTRVNYHMVLTPYTPHYVSGVFRNTNMNSPESVPGTISSGRSFDVSDCPDFEFSTVTFPGLAAMIASGKTFYFKSCNMPVGSVVHYYDPKVNTWDNIDFTKAMADLGKALPNNENIMLVSSNKQGWYRMLGKTSKSFGALVEALSSVNAANFISLADSYDSVIYKDCVIKGAFTIKGRNVFGGTQGGASRLSNTSATVVIDGSFRIEGNAQVTDTPLKGTGYIGGNAELKNGVVEGYIYVDGNAKYIPEAVTNPYIIRMLIMTGNSKVLKQSDVSNHSVRIRMSDNAVLDAEIFGDRGTLVMRDNATITKGSGTAVTFYGVLTLEGNASIKGSSSFVAYGDTTLTGGFAQTSGARLSYGRVTLSDVSQIGVYNLPQTKENW